MLPASRTRSKGRISAPRHEPANKANNTAQDNSVIRLVRGSPVNVLGLRGLAGAIICSLRYWLLANAAS